MTHAEAQAEAARVIEEGTRIKAARDKSEASRLAVKAHRANMKGVAAMDK